MSRLRNLYFLIGAIVSGVSFLTSCLKPPYKADKNIAGFVIGKEICHTDESKDYWLIDFTFHVNTPKLGDTLVLNGATYSNVLKVKNLHPNLKLINLPVSLDYEVISATKVNTTGCDVANATTYALKEIFPIAQFEIR